MIEKEKPMNKFYRHVALQSTLMSYIRYKINLLNINRIQIAFRDTK